MPKEIYAGEWRANPDLEDYRMERLSDMLVERATWHSAAPMQSLGSVVIGGPGFIWLRFWLVEPDQIIEKYFDADGHVVGLYVPICTPLVYSNRDPSTRALTLGLWLEPDGRVIVLGEAEFDASAHAGEITPVEVEAAEQRIRELTLLIAHDRFPPALIRNLQIDKGSKP